MKRKSTLDAFYDNQETLDQMRAKKVVAQFEANETLDQKKAKEVVAQLEQLGCVCPRCRQRVRERSGEGTCPGCGASLES